MDEAYQVRSSVNGCGRVVRLGLDVASCVARVVVGMSGKDSSTTLERDDDGAGTFGASQVIKQFWPNPRVWGIGDR